MGGGEIEGVVESQECVAGWPRPDPLPFTTEHYES